jgi:hypothetical protein
MNGKLRYECGLGHARLSSETLRRIALPVTAGLLAAVMTAVLFSRTPVVPDVRRVAQPLEDTRAVLLKMEHALEDLREQTVRLGEDEARVTFDRDLTSLLALNRRAQLSLGTALESIKAKEGGTSLYVAKPASPQGR